MNIMAGTNVLHVPYRGAAPSVTDVATGDVTMSFTSLAAAQGLMQAGKVRAVAVTSLERMPQLPDVEPLQNGAPGLKGYELLNWFGLFTTAARRRGGEAATTRSPSKRWPSRRSPETLSTQGIVPRKMTPEQFKAFVQSESKKFAASSRRPRSNWPTRPASTLWRRAATIRYHGGSGISKSPRRNGGSPWTPSPRKARSPRTSIRIWCVPPKWNGRRHVSRLRGEDAAVRSRRPD